MSKRRNKKQINRPNTENAREENKNIEVQPTEALESEINEQPESASEDFFGQPEEADVNMTVQPEEAEPENQDQQEAAPVPIDQLLEEEAAPKEELLEKELLEDELAEEKISLDKHQLEMTSDFAEFARDFFQRVGKWFKANRKMALIALGACAGVVFLIWIVVSISRSVDSARLTSVSDNFQIEIPGNNGVIPVPQDPYQVNAYPAVNELVTRYFDAMQNNDIETLRSLKNYMDALETAKVNVKYQYVESYDNIVCYTKRGPFPDTSYIVYVCYDVKMRNQDVIAPSLQTLLVCTDSNGQLYIYVGDFDENVADYIAKISSQDDVYDLWQSVETEYKEIMDENPDFAEYMSELTQIIKDEVGEQLVAEGYLEDGTEEPAQEIVNNVSDDGAGETEAQEEFEVQALTTVNVRTSDSEVADRIGRVEAGTTLMCQEHQVNGWSRITYEGQTGYIKTEYLLTVGETVDESTANGTVVVAETVNVRGTADVNGIKLGVAYAGESFPLIGNTNGEWTQIIYNGQNGFIKSEFILNH